MVSKIFGYCRVSTKEQNITLQVESLVQNGVPEENIFQEKMSGKNAERPQFLFLFKQLREGDHVVVTDISRISRSTKDFLTILDDFEKRGITLKSLNQPWLDTKNSHGKFILTIFTAVNQMERELICERTRIGLASARAHGRVGGRRPLKKNIVKDLLVQYNSQQYSVSEICKNANIARSTLYKYIRLQEQEKKQEQEKQKH